jgi:hypothetical protein
VPDSSKNRQANRNGFKNCPKPGVLTIPACARSLRGAQLPRGSVPDLLMCSFSKPKAIARSWRPRLIPTALAGSRQNSDSKLQVSDRPPASQRVSTSNAKPNPAIGGHLTPAVVLCRPAAESSIVDEARQWLPEVRSAGNRSNSGGVEWKKYAPGLGENHRINFSSADGLSPPFPTPAHPHLDPGPTRQFWR